MKMMTALDLSNKRVMIREDLNVPIIDGNITDDERIQRALPTLRKALSQNAAVIVLSHLGRPAEGAYDLEHSLAPVALALSEALGQDVPLIKGWLDGVDVAPGQIVLCENVRFNEGEKSNDELLAKKMAALCDVFVMDAFATAHRAQASTEGVARYAKVACAGPLLVAELKAFHDAFDQPKRPLVAIVGGSKVSSKIEALERLVDMVDTLIVGGGIANTLLAAKGYNVGKSLYEADRLEWSKQLLDRAGDKIPLPVDVAVAESFDEHASRVVRSIDDVKSDEMILDVGPETMATYPALMQDAKTIVWNGPVGVFEFAAFADGTRALGEAIANSNAYSVGGGGDTVSAIHQFGIQNKISYISTGGGAFLELLEGKALPGVTILEKKGQ